jgi:hypothetical protein
MEEAKNFKVTKITCFIIYMTNIIYNIKKSLFSYMHVVLFGVGNIGKLRLHPETF